MIFGTLKNFVSSVPYPASDEKCATAAHPSRDKLICATLCALLGGLLVYGAGFTSDIRLHNAAHDARHAAGFPCN